ncbi:MAG TPA: hypothetical protein GXX74_08160 [Clostridiales bacterium]|nr:hypothetical protein [Clostridiales bacterium]
MGCTKQDAEIIKKIMTEEISDDKAVENELRAEIYDELHKPDDEMDCDLIDENIQTLFMLEGRNYENHIDLEEELNKARKKSDTAQPKLQKDLRRFMKPVLAACMAIVVFFSANAAVVHATGNGILDKVVQFGRNYVGFDFTKKRRANFSSVRTNHR